MLSCHFQGSNQRAAIVDGEGQLGQMGGDGLHEERERDRERIGDGSTRIEREERGRRFRDDLLLQAARRQLVVTPHERIRRRTGQPAEGGETHRQVRARVRRSEHPVDRPGSRVGGEPVEHRPGLLGRSIVVHHDRVDVFENVGIFEVPSVARTGMHDEGRRTIHHDPGQFEVAAHASQTPVIAKCVRSASNP